MTISKTMNNPQSKVVIPLDRPQSNEVIPIKTAEQTKLLKTAVATRNDKTAFLMIGLVALVIATFILLK